MTEYARIENGAIVSLMPEPYGVIMYGTRHWDFRDPGVREEWMSRYGYVRVQTVARPEDTDTVAHERTVDVVDGTPVEVWTERAWTPEESLARGRAATAAQLVTDATGDNERVREVIDYFANTLLGAATVDGSIRQWRGTVNNTYSAARERALADVLLAQAQEIRKLSRQVLRLGKLATGDTSSSDVGQA